MWSLCPDDIRNGKYLLWDAAASLLKPASTYGHIYTRSNGAAFTAGVYRNDIFALHAEDNDDINKAFRHASYRQFILWQFGRLIAGDRHVIPSCVVCRIRQTYPSELGVYTGYRPGRLF